MPNKSDWSDGNYMEWADQERLVRQDIEEINRDLRRKKGHMEQKFEILKTVAVLSGYDGYGYRKELNLVSWNDRNPKYDIRAWNKDHSMMKKGIVLNNEEMRILLQAVQSIKED